MIPVFVLTGFLGSGKTTLLARLLKSPQFSRTAVIINEFGEVGIDHDLIETSEESFIELETGCLCCAVRGDLMLTLEDILRRRDMGSVAPFERVVIETSGLADPAPILHALMTDATLASRLSLAGVVTTIDAVNGLATLERQAESIKQIAVADHLILSKSDLCEGKPEVLLARLKALNPTAPLTTALHGEIDAASVFATHHDAHSRLPPEIPADAMADHGGLDRFPLEVNHNAASSPHGGGEYRRVDPTDVEHSSMTDIGMQDRGHRRAHVPFGAHAHSPHQPDIACFAILREKPMRAVTLTLLLEVLAEHCGADILRLKGIINIAESPDRPAVIHGVQHVFHPPAWLECWPSADTRSRMVFIVRDVSRDWIEAVLAAVEAEVEEVHGGV